VLFVNMDGKTVSQAEEDAAEALRKRMHMAARQRAIVTLKALMKVVDHSTTKAVDDGWEQQRSYLEGGVAVGGESVTWQEMKSAVEAGEQAGLKHEKPPKAAPPADAAAASGPTVDKDGAVVAATQPTDKSKHAEVASENAPEHPHTLFLRACKALRQAQMRKDLADKREAMLVPWRVVIAKDGLLVTLRKALRDSSRPNTRKDLLTPGLGNVFTDMLVAELANASYKLTAACRNGNTYDRMKKEVGLFNLLHEQNAFHWAELIELSNALVASKEFMLEDQVAETLADRSKRTS